MKNRKRIIYLSLLSIFFVVLLTSCNDKEDLPILDITDKVNFGNSPFGHCFSPIGEAYRREIIFTDNETYQTFGTYTIEQFGGFMEGCGSAILPPFDFAKSSIIGNYIRFLSNSRISYKITDNPNSKTIIYSIMNEYLNSSDTVLTIGMMNWAIIPKLKDNYTVEFEVEQIGVDQFTDSN